MGKTPPKKEEAEGSPKNKAARVDDAAPITASAPSSTGKTPPKGDEAEGSPRKKAPRLSDVNLPGTSEPNPTGKTPPKEKAEGSPPKTPRSPRQQDQLPAATGRQATVSESSELTVKGVARASDKKRCNCNHVITDSAMHELRAIEEVSSSPKYKDALTCFGCSDEDKEGIIKTRPEKSDLLICVTCSGYLCCGVGLIAYPYGHSRAHAQNKEHWFAVLYCDPQRGYCFKCNAEVPMLLLAPPPSVGQSEAAVNPEKVKMPGKVQAESHPSGCKSSDAHGYAIRGISNLGNTCYMSAVLQCLFVLGKLRERILADHPKGHLPEVLKELFVEARAAGDVLDPTQDLRREVLRIIGFKVGSMEDSYEFLALLRTIWLESEKAPTVIDSIFKFEMLVSCKKCCLPLKSESYMDLTMSFPSKWHPTKSAASPQTSKSPRSRKREIPLQLLPADMQRNLEKMQTVSESGDSRVIGSEVIVENMHKPLEVDSTESQSQHISKSKDVVQSPLQIQEGNSVDSLTEGSTLIKDFLLLFSKGEMACCLNCAKDHEEPSASQSKNGEQIVGSGNEDDVGDTVGTLRFLTLPPVLTLHLKRTYMADNTAGIKISGHVTFEEDLDVKPFMDTRSADKGSTLYRLAGVVEHIGKGSLNSGHYIAYVRARRLGNQQEGSNCSSSWFCADDLHIRQVTLEQVLKTEAYILFYERIEDPVISSMPNDILSSWEMIQSDEIVNCNTDPSDTCYVLKLKPEEIPLLTQLMHNKYNTYAVNIFQNNKINVEWLQQGLEWIEKVAPLFDLMLPLPLCSLAVSTSAHINKAMKVAAIIGQAYELLQSVTEPPKEFTILFVANKAQARNAVTTWNAARRSPYYCAVLDGVEYDELQILVDELEAWSLFFNPEPSSCQHTSPR